MSACHLRSVETKQPGASLRAAEIRLRRLESRTVSMEAGWRPGGAGRIVDQVYSGGLRRRNGVRDDFAQWPAATGDGPRL
jgi:hypothetical protein